MKPSTQTLPAFVRWQQEGEKHRRAGDYDWMAGLVGGDRVLEIGCGAGFSTQALARRAGALLVLESDDECRRIAETRVQESGPQADVSWLGADLLALSDEARRQIADFAPTWIVCWMYGVPDQALDASLPQPQAVQKAREAAQRAVAELAAGLSTVQAVHLVDRTAFPWKIKDTARETLVLIHSAKTFAGLPFACRREDAIYRKLDPLTWPEGMQRSTAGIVPVLGSLIARRAP